jgi:hypothetical protein
MPTPVDPLDATPGADADPPSSQTMRLHTEILILPEGKVLVHNLTPVMAAILKQLNPCADEIRDRVAVARGHEKPGLKGDRHI